MKGKGRIVLAVGAVVIVAIVVAGLVRRPSPARWQGKTTEEWFKEFRAAGGGPPAAFLRNIGSGRMTAWQTANGQQVIISTPPGIVAAPPGMGGPGRVVFGTGTAMFGYAPEEMLRHPSADGLHGLGTNAAIFLAGELRRKDLPLAGTYARLYTRFPGVLKRVLPAPSEPSSRVRRDAAVALAVIGTNAWPAAPSFHQGREDGN